MENRKRVKLEARGLQSVEIDHSSDDPAIFRLSDDRLTYIFSFLSIKKRIQIQRGMYN